MKRGNLHNGCERWVYVCTRSNTLETLQERIGTAFLLHFVVQFLCQLCQLLNSEAQKKCYIFANCFASSVQPAVETLAVS